MVDTPSVRERRLASELRALRTTAGLHGKDVAATLGWSASKVSRIENGRTGIGEADLERLVELYRVPDAQAGYLRRLAPSVRPRGWWDAYAETLSPGYANLVRLESGSQALRCYGALVPHALLQTTDYAREVILSTWERPSPAEVERRVEVCRRRQEVLDTGRADGGLLLHAVVDESVLRRSAVPRDPARDSAVRRGQLERLAAVADLPNVTLQVLPFAAGLPPVTAGSFAVLDSPASGTPDVVYLENKTRIFFIDAEAELHRYTRAFDLISEMALDPAASRALVTRELAGC
ncbi:helix-turn-helix domain-containing protein [Modestobacter versicolor]|uniref:Transcriptional regulator with XRE-family HTH domain n=1 Tax=Modestobacter versicolor TaxID=429133 RepID=A0A323V487_9ACTN|nr:helix-turn-helix transcriptional regulator [Modestobacter versicolor]MBB3674940.1 transcriptional regulator with XRE-family HTH domain [Modestobacter versicolor]PZA19615.1 XRE family transcriptional regulator [Modestobacter versicolor]